MYILFFLIHLTFSGIFYFFGKTAEAIIFFIAGIAFFFSFAPFSLKGMFTGIKDKKTSQSHEKTPNKSLRESYIQLLSWWSYYGAIISFYIAFAGISYSLSSLFTLSFEIFYGISTLLVAFIAALLFVIFPKNEFINRFFYTNTLVFSLIILLFLGGIPTFFPKFNDTYVLINAFFALISFPFLFYIPFSFRKNKVLIPSFVGLFLSILVYILVIHFWFPFLEVILSLLFLFSVASFEILLKIPKLRPYREIGLQNGFILLLCCVPFIGMYHFFNSFDFFLGFFLVIYVIFLMFLFKRFSFTFSWILALFTLWYWYIGAFFPGTTPSSFVGYYFFLSIFPFGILALEPFIRQNKRVFENMFGISVGHFFIFSIASYFFFEDFSILWTSFLFLTFSSLLFITYTRFKKS